MNNEGNGLIEQLDQKMKTYIEHRLKQDRKQKRESKHEIQFDI